MVSKKARKINYALGISYLLIIFVAGIIEMIFPFEILQEVLTVDNQRNYTINELMSSIVGLTIMFLLGHLGYMIGVAKTEESLKKV